MDIYQSEDEQVEALKKWWKENGTSVIVGLIVGVGAVLGWRGWVGYTESQGQRASMAYEEMLGAVENGEHDSAVKAGERIQKEYASTPYADLAGLGLAQVYVNANDPASAERQLVWVMENTGSAEMRHIARLRLARVWFAQERVDAALDLIQAEESGSFAAIYEELKGDLHKSKGAVSEARSAYQKALAVGTKNHDLVQMKLDELGTAPGKES